MLPCDSYSPPSFISHHPLLSISLFLPSVNSFLNTFISPLDFNFLSQLLLPGIDLTSNSVIRSDYNKLRNRFPLMASSTLIPNSVTNNARDTSRESSKRRKRKKLQKLSNSNNDRDHINNHDNDQIRPWKSEVQQQIYSSKLLQALRHVRSGAGVKSRRDVRDAADRVLAVTAKGRTRWSRAILTNKLKLKFMKNNRRQRGVIATATGNSRLKKPRVSILRLKTKNISAVQRKARVLGGLVPGCRKQPLPVVLEEATDYIPALEMQVKAMAALVELLSGGSSSISGAGTVTGAGNLSQLSFSRPSPNL